MFLKVQISRRLTAAAGSLRPSTALFKHVRWFTLVLVQTGSNWFLFVSLIIIGATLIPIYSRSHLPAAWCLTFKRYLLETGSSKEAPHRAKCAMQEEWQETRHHVKIRVPVRDAEARHLLEQAVMVQTHLHSPPALQILTRYSKFVLCNPMMNRMVDVKATKFLSRNQNSKTLNPP